MNKQIIFAGIVLLLITASLINGCEETTSNSGNLGEPGSQSNQNSLFEKTSGFTLDDCNNLCDLTYDIQAQVNVCQGSCAMLGKPSSTMDKTCLNIISIHKRNVDNSS